MRMKQGKRFVARILAMTCALSMLGSCGKATKVSAVDDNYRNYYEIFTRSFYDTDGDGIGDLAGVTEKLDYVAEMGFNGIWLMPIMPSPTYHKYDVTDYKAIDKEYGDEKDFDKLVKACHKRGIRIIIDLVMNHTSSKHPWFTEACKYLESLPKDQKPDTQVCPYVDYYHFSKKQVDGSYYQVGQTGWYYEGSFWSEMPDLNLANPAVQKEFEEIADYWIEKGVDGFRMDAVLHFEENQTAFNTECLRNFYAYCKQKNENFYMVAEAWTAENTIGDYYDSQIPSMFNFPTGNAEGLLAAVAKENKDAEKLVNAMCEYQEVYGAHNADYIDAPFASNHDTTRISNMLNGDENAIKYAAGVLLTMSGSPFVYYGEEIGMASKGDKDENKRLPMLWYSEKDSKQKGMTTKPKDADKGVKSLFPSVEEQLKDENSILRYYQKALKIRNENPEIARGVLEVEKELTSGDIAVTRRIYEEKQVAVIYNTAQEDKKIALSESNLKDMKIVGTLSEKEEASYEDGMLTVPARAIVIMR